MLCSVSLSRVTDGRSSLVVGGRAASPDRRACSFTATLSVVCVLGAVNEFGFRYVGGRWPSYIHLVLHTPVCVHRGVRGWCNQSPREACMREIDKALKCISLVVAVLGAIVAIELHPNTSNPHTTPTRPSIHTRQHQAYQARGCPIRRTNITEVDTDVRSIYGLSGSCH